ncbi:MULTISPECIES: helix-turn-helix transcriptional regulator [Pseudomonas putida group]|uniref:helix-turn-helix transcriptional regulator n=1 Tax=Pseudomonas putida group TaxID=136845 RepID=UPI00037FD92A|nr:MULTISPECIES: helix-turn-helix domain-containing protein [Pseudomonas putida group]ANC80958.1 hypothetical protein KKK_08005 [Pseudomonas putida B6-2]MDH0023905.1 helix-turn-helix domain-containing protein [Pseudomonas monteilii]
MNKENDFCTPAEISRALGISRSTFWRWRDLPEFPKPKKIGMRQMHFSLSAVKQFLADANVLTSERNGAKTTESPAPTVDLRDYLAAKALPVAWAAFNDGYFDAGEWDSINRSVAECAYQMADAMLAARVKP